MVTIRQFLLYFLVCGELIYLGSGGIILPKLHKACFFFYTGVVVFIKVKDLGCHAAVGSEMVHLFADLIAHFGAAFAAKISILRHFPAAS